MKLASFRSPSGVRTGVVIDDEIVDLAAADPQLCGPMEQLIGGGPEVLDRVQEAAESGKQRRPLMEVELAPPVQPRKFFAIGLNYADHVAESGLPTPENLIVFAKAVSCVNGPFDAIERPIVSDKLDYEGELGFVIGRRCRHVSAADAADVIAGYLVINDVSVRDWQMMTPQWNLGKSFDTHGPIGPWLTTSDEVGDPHTLGIRTSVNGDLRQESNTRHLIFDCYRQVEVLSTVCTLEPGDVVATGTPSGVAAARDGQPWLVPGDSVRIEIDGLGAIDNAVVQEPGSAREADMVRARAVAPVQR
jgi:2-keto-4-pentenoate hydratase/2-oxohepta-3-ene-1,7-dioic acid hydratase in catechol pathway